MPYAELNSLYHHVLSNIDNIETFKQVLGTLIIVNSIPELENDQMDSTFEMDQFFFWQPGETKACLNQLASVIGCNTYGNISIFHASLSDFLLDPSRSHQFYLCRKSVLGDIAALGLRHIRQQEYNENGLSNLPSRKFIL